MNFQQVRREATILFAMMAGLRRGVRERVLGAGGTEGEARAAVARVLSTKEAPSIGEAVLQELAEAVGGLRLFDLEDPGDRGAVRRLLISAYKLHVNADMGRADVVDALADEIGGEDADEDAGGAEAGAGADVAGPAAPPE